MPSNIKVSEFDSLLRRQHKILSTKEFALANSFLFISFSSESIFTWDFVQFDILEAPVF